MKGIILAGGRATRLYPLTLVTNKHLLPVYDKPVIYYAIEKMASAGIDKIMVVTSPENIHDFVNLLGSGQNFKSAENTVLIKGRRVKTKRSRQVQIVYGIQNKPGGIAQGLWIAKEYIGSDDCVLYLGDNIFMDDISKHIKNFRGGATVFLKEVADPERFGVAKVDDFGRVIGIEEKPRKPKSNLAVTGLYVYDNSVFSKMPLKKSTRGEYEISYVNNQYIKEKSLKAVVLKKDWFDVGTIDSLLLASNFMKRQNKNGSAKK